MYVNYKYLFLLFSILLSVILSANDTQIDLRNIEEYQLENGMKILIAPNHENPIVYIYAYINAGEIDSPIDKPNLAEFTFSTMKTGTKKYPKFDDIKSQLRNLGNENSDFVWYGMEEELSYIENYCMKKDTRECIEIIAEILINPLLNTRQYFWLKILEKFAPKKMKLDNDAVSSSHIYNMYANKEYNNNPDEWMSYNKKEVEKWYKEYIRPENITLMITGDINYIYIKKIIHEYFNNWNVNTPLPKRREYKTNLTSESGIKFRFINNDTMTDFAKTRIMTFAPSFKDDWFQAGSLAKVIMGNQNSGRISKLHALFDRSGYIYTWRNYRERMPYYGIYTNTKYSNLLKYYTEIRNEFSKFASNSITKEELDIAKKFRINHYQNKFYNLESFSAITQEYYNQGYSLEDISDIEKRINAVTLEEVNAAAKRMFNPDNFMMVIMGNKDSSATFLNQFKDYEYFELTDEIK